MFEFKMTGLNQKNLERLLTDAAEKPAKAFEAELNQRASHIRTLDAQQAQSEVDRIARKHGITLSTGNPPGRSQTPSSAAAP